MKYFSRFFVAIGCQVLKTFSFYSLITRYLHFIFFMSCLYASKTIDAVLHFKQHNSKAKMVANYPFQRFFKRTPLRLCLISFDLFLWHYCTRWRAEVSTTINTDHDETPVISEMFVHFHA